jgi:hypothetical protein
MRLRVTPAVPTRAQLATAWLSDSA